MSFAAGLSEVQESGEQRHRRFDWEIAPVIIESKWNDGPFMRISFKVLALAFALPLPLGTVGCTLFPTKNPPTLASTTSAEQHERILWQMAEKQQWDRITPLFSTTLVWSVDGKRLTRDQVAPYLKSLNLQDAQVRDASFQPNGGDMTVSYTLQLSGGRGALLEYSAFSVWQQLKNGGYVLIAHSQQARTGSSAAAQ